MSNAYAPVADDVKISVKSRDRNRWADLYDALLANPNVWLAVPAHDADSVRRAGKASVQARLDGDNGPGGIVTYGETETGGTVIRYVPADGSAPTSPKAPKKA